VFRKIGSISANVCGIYEGGQQYNIMTAVWFGRTRC